ncbi:MAG: serine/threonine-protein kinase [Planctomycetota bacterium]
MGSPHDVNDLRYAVLCLRFGILNSAELDDAFEATRQSGGRKGLAELLLEQGLVSQAIDAHFRALLEAHLDSNDGDAEASFRSLSDGVSLADRLTELTDRGDQTTDFEWDSDGQPVSTRPPDPAYADAELVAGRFLPLAPHRVGGMGEVLRARDLQLNRVVALKQLQDRFSDRQNYCDRFLYEGQVTGLLEHPAIVPVYALGETGDAVPYYAMRFIDGQTLTEAIAALHKNRGGRSLSRGSAPFRDLLQRFVQACYAIDFAHSRGVLHRDMKPHNVMVGEHQETWVVDWGLATNVRAGADEDTHPISDNEPIRRHAETQMGAAIGTPNYMSPEQARGDVQAMTEATDIFNLGATLYHLLTNHAPYRNEDASATMDTARDCLWQAPRAVKQDIPRQLDAIVRKAMAKNPADRYASARELAADVERWIADERVLAAPDPITDRVARWARRHRGAAVAGAVALAAISMVSVAAAVTVNRQRAVAESLSVENQGLAEQREKARAIAQGRLEDAQEAVDDWLTRFSEVSRDIPGVASVRGELLDRAREHYERFVAAEEDLPFLPAEQQRELRIERCRTLLRLGKVHYELGELDDAVADYRSAGSLAGELRGSGGSDRDATLILAISLNRQALVHRARGDAAAAIEAADGAVAECQRVVGAGKETPRLVGVQVAALNNKGQVLLLTDRPREASGAFNESLTRIDRLKSEDPNNVSHDADRAEALLGVGQALVVMGRSADAADAFERAAAAAGVAAAANPGSRDFRQLLADCRMFQGATARNLGDPGAAIAAFDAALEDYNTLQTLFPSVPAFFERSLVAKCDLGQLYLENGQPGRAGALLTEVIKVLQPFAASSDPADFQPREELALALDNLAQALLWTGDAAGAVREAAQAEQLFTRLADEMPRAPVYRRMLAIAESHHAQGLDQLDKASEADARFRRAYLRLAEEAGGPAGDEEGADGEVVALRYALAMIGARWGDAARSAGRADEALEHYSAAGSDFRLLSDRSADPRHHYEAGWFFLLCPAAAARDPLAALPCVELAFSASPTNARYAAAVALHRLATRQTDEAMVVVQDSRLDTEGHEARLGYVTAIANSRRGDAAAAQQAFDLAAERKAATSPGDPELHWLHLEAERVLAETEDEAETRAE